MIRKSDCSTCYKVSTTSAGPSFKEMPAKYQSDSKAVDYHAIKVMKGRSGVWGEIPMTAHPAMKESEVKKITEWIITLSNKEALAATLPTSGIITPATTINKKESVANTWPNRIIGDLNSKGGKKYTWSNSTSHYYKDSKRMKCGLIEPVKIHFSETIILHAFKIRTGI